MEHYFPVKCCFGDHLISYSVSNGSLKRLRATCDLGAELFPGSCASLRLGIIQVFRDSGRAISLQKVVSGFGVSWGNYDPLVDCLDYSQRIRGIRGFRCLGDPQAFGLEKRLIAFKIQKILDGIASWFGKALKISLFDCYGRWAVQVDRGEDRWQANVSDIYLFRDGDMPGEIAEAICWAVSDPLAYAQFREHGIEVCLKPFALEAVNGYSWGEMQSIAGKTSLL